jgi:MFS family permease
VLQAVLLQAFAASGLFLVAAWLPSYFMQLSGMAASTALLIQTLNMAALTGSMLLGGLLADEFDPAPVLLATCAVAIAYGWPAWLLFSLGVAEVTWFAQCMLCVLVGLHWGALTEVLLDRFPPGVSQNVGQATTLNIVITCVCSGFAVHKQQVYSGINPAGFTIQQRDISTAHEVQLLIYMVRLVQYRDCTAWPASKCGPTVLLHEAADLLTFLC